MARCTVVLLIGCLLSFALLTPSLAAELRPGRPDSAVSLRWENDTGTGNDGNYTNGLSLAVTTAGPGLLGGIWNLAGDTPGERFSVYEVGQFIFTPSDIDRPDPDPSDRPYAGLLYLGFTTWLQRPESLHGLKLRVGVVGPSSLAEDGQEFFHNAFSGNFPAGWHHQLKDEPVFDIQYEYRRRFALTPREAHVGAELIPVVNLTGGTFLTQARAEAQFRIGYQLPDDFGTTVLRGSGHLPFPQATTPDRTWGFYLFGGGSVAAVGRDLSLDGNTYRNGPRVNREWFVSAAEFGAALWTRNMQLAFAYMVMSDEFTTQKENGNYGSALLSVFF